MGLIVSNRIVNYLTACNIRGHVLLDYVRSKGFESDIEKSFQFSWSLITTPIDIYNRVKHLIKNDNTHVSVILDYASFNKMEGTLFYKVIRDTILLFPEINFYFDETHNVGNNNKSFLEYLSNNSEKAQSKSDELKCNVCHIYHSFIRPTNDKNPFEAIILGKDNLFDASNLRYFLRCLKYEDLKLHNNFEKIQTSRANNLALCVEEERGQSLFNSLALYLNGFRVLPITSSGELKYVNSHISENAHTGIPKPQIIIRDYDLQFADSPKGDSDQICLIRGWSFGQVKKNNDDKLTNFYRQWIKQFNTRPISLNEKISLSIDPNYAKSEKLLVNNEEGDLIIASARDIINNWTSNHNIHNIYENAAMVDVFWMIVTWREMESSCYIKARKLRGQILRYLHDYNKSIYNLLRDIERYGHQEDRETAKIILKELDTLKTSAEHLPDRWVCTLTDSNQYWNHLYDICTYYISKGAQDKKGKRNMILYNTPYCFKRFFSRLFRSGQCLYLPGLYKPVSGLYVPFRKIKLIKKRYEESRDTSCIITKREGDNGHSTPLDVYSLAKDMIERAEHYYEQRRYVYAAILSQEAIEIMNGFHQVLSVRAFRCLSLAENAAAAGALGTSEEGLSKDTEFRLRRIRDVVTRLSSLGNEGYQKRNKSRNTLNQIYNDIRLYCKDKEYFKAEDEVVRAIGHLNERII